MQIIDAHNVTRIKQITLDKEQVRLQSLKEDLAEREKWEEARLSVERVEKAKKERLAREKIEEARRRAQAAQEAKDRAAGEAAERVRQQQWAAQQARDKAAREQAERFSQQQQAVYEARQRAAREAEEERILKTETLYANFQRRQREEARKTEEEQTKRDQARKTCKHSGEWVKVADRHDCTYCMRPLFKFTEQCPSCGIMACTSCRDILKAGGTPLSYRERNGRSNRCSRPTPREFFFALVALWLCQKSLKAISQIL
jgi:hypothetical protein